MLLTRYFYTDPLAAAWMARTYGVIFEDYAGFRFKEEDTFWHLEPLRKLFVHKDSIHLFEPKNGDIGDIEGWGPVTFSRDRWISGGIVISNGIYKIIQRNGIAFMWPETDSTEKASREALEE